MISGANLITWVVLWKRSLFNPPIRLLTGSVEKLPSVRESWCCVWVPSGSILCTCSNSFSLCSTIPASFWSLSLQFRLGLFFDTSVCRIWFASVVGIFRWQFFWLVVHAWAEWLFWATSPLARIYDSLRCRNLQSFSGSRRCWIACAITFGLLSELFAFKIAQPSRPVGGPEGLFGKWGHAKKMCQKTKRGYCYSTI